MGVDLVAMAQVGEADGLELEVLRELTPSDLAALPSPKSKPHVVKTLRHTHHLAAKLIAEGRKNQEVCAITGYSPSRVSILKQDPAFQDLVAYYAEQVREAFTNVHAKLAALGEACVEELMERLDDKPESFSHNQIREVMEATLDRSVAPKKGPNGQAASNSTGVVINVEFKAPQAPQGPVIDIKAEALPKDTDGNA